MATVLTLSLPFPALAELATLSARIEERNKAYEGGFVRYPAARTLLDQSEGTPTRAIRESCRPPCPPTPRPSSYYPPPLRPSLFPELLASS